MIRITYFNILAVFCFYSDLRIYLSANRRKQNIAINKAINSIKQRALYSKADESFVSFV